MKINMNINDTGIVYTFWKLESSDVGIHNLKGVNLEILISLVDSITEILRYVGSGYDVEK
jgi:hypothetical protein